MLSLNKMLINSVHDGVRSYTQVLKDRRYKRYLSHAWLTIISALLAGLSVKEWIKRVHKGVNWMLLY